MAKATSSRESSTKAEVSLYSDTLPTDSPIGDIEKHPRRASAARHARKCTVCHHKDREFIDQDYLRWLSPKKIAREYAISHQSIVYRHADATGLRAQRRASLRATLENFIEQAESVRATAGSVVAAVRLYAQINDQGQWTPPVRRHIVEHHYVGTPDPHSSHTKNDPENSQERSPKGSAAPAPTPASAPKKDGVPPSATPDAVSANAPDPEVTKNHPELAKGMASVHKNSDPVNATGRLQPVATITAGSAVPFGTSPEKFPAVPVATINLAPDLPVSNREHVELEHAPTH